MLSWCVEGEGEGEEEGEGVEEDLGWRVARVAPSGGRRW